MSLSYDVSRCLGEQGGYVCPDRYVCERYVAHRLGSNERFAPVAQLLREPESKECDYIIDVEI